METEDAMDLGIITEMITDAYNIRASSINYGYCYIWAYLAYLVYPKARLHFNSGHAWISLGDKHYDADTPRGVRNPSNLTMYRGYTNLAHHKMRWNVKPEVFIEYWCDSGRYGEYFEMAAGRKPYPEEMPECKAA